MTKHNKSFVGPKEESKIIKIKNISYFNNFYFKRNVNYSLPKVLISLNIFHPYLRPNNSNITISKCYYFKIIEFFTAIKRKIEEELADAIRAGNEIEIGKIVHFLFIDVFCYEDVAYKIIKKIKNIIFDFNWKLTDFISNNVIYMNEAFDDNFIYNKNNIGDISKYYFQCKL